MRQLSRNWRRTTSRTSTLGLHGSHRGSGVLGYGRRLWANSGAMTGVRWPARHGNSRQATRQQQAAWQATTLQQAN